MLSLRILNLGIVNNKGFLLTLILLCNCRIFKVSFAFKVHARKMVEAAMLAHVNSLAPLVQRHFLFGCRRHIPAALPAVTLAPQGVVFLHPPGELQRVLVCFKALFLCLPAYADHRLFFAILHILRLPIFLFVSPNPRRLPFFPCSPRNGILWSHPCFPSSR